MVDAIPILTPANAPRVAKAKVTEKNPHHQNEQNKKKQSEEIEDEVVISEKDTPEEKDKPAPVLPLHNIDIEA